MAHPAAMLVTMMFAAQGAGAATPVGGSDASDWWQTSGSYRLRFESLNHPFRAGATGSDQMLAQRLLVHVTAGRQRLKVGFELEDSRAFLDDSGSPLGADDVNVLEPLQAYLTGTVDPGFATGSQLAWRVGRFTMDVGSRRLVARNRFRNTLNAFTGAPGWRAPATSTAPRCCGIRAAIPAA